MVVAGGDSDSEDGDMSGGTADDDIDENGASEEWEIYDNNSEDFESPKRPPSSKGIGSASSNVKSSSTSKKPVPSPPVVTPPLVRAPRPVDNRTEKVIMF